MRVAAFQFDVRRGEVAANLAAVEAGLRAAADQGVKVVGLPELWPTSFVTPEDEPDDAGGGGGDWIQASEDAIASVADLARELDLVVFGSGLAAGPESGGEAGLPFNRLHVIDRGDPVLTYDKVHLFSPTGEGEGFTAGTAPPLTADAGGTRVSGVICYDLRFGPLLDAAFEDRPELLLVPAQWPVPRASHWSVLVRGRAAEGQCVVIGVNRTGVDLVGRRRLELAFPGNSLIAGPGGEVLAEGQGESGLLIADVDLDALCDLRRTVPAFRDRRADLYRGWADLRD